MLQKIKSFEDAISSIDLLAEDYCGTSYAAKLLGLSVATVQALVEKGEIEAWKTLGGHRRIALKSIHAYLSKTGLQRPKPTTDSSDRLSILVVEDDEDTLELYRCQFDEWDLPVDCTWMSSALGALMDIASMRPDLLITDLSMPGVDGLEMLKVIKRNHHLADMQILVISGLAKEAIAARGGVPLHTRLMQKPINFDWLQGYVTALVTANVQWHIKAQSVSRDGPQSNLLELPNKFFKENTGVGDVRA